MSKEQAKQPQKKEERQEECIKVLNHSLIKKLFIGGYNLLDTNKAYVDSLNVFPVPDGDTGLNMSLTMKSVIKEMEALSSTDTIELLSAIAKGALKGARGNSGVITSQIIKGLTNELISHLSKAGPGKSEPKITTKIFANALCEGSKMAYKAVSIPKEGTILTVIREIGDAAQIIARKTVCFDAFLEQIIDAGEQSLAKTPDLLPVLKKAGVVDAGGRGLIIILRGFLGAINGQVELDLNFDSDSAVVLDTQDEVAKFEDISEIEFAYCTEFFVINIKKTTTMAKIDQFRETLMKLGDSVICVGDLSFIKVHVHTNTPGLVLTEALKLGELHNLKIENMLEQNRELRKARNIEDKPLGIVAVCAGEGIANVFRELGVDYIIKGGQTMNPSAEDIAKAVDKVHAKTVFVFPNNKNIVLAAMNAQSLTNVQIVVIPTHSINEGITACINFNPDGTVEENTQTFIDAKANVQSASVTYAVRDTNLDGLEIKKDDIIGLDSKSIRVKGRTANEVAHKLIEKLITKDTINVTLFYGEGVSEKDAENLSEKLGAKYPNCEFQVINGGQPIYSYLISLE